MNVAVLLPTYNEEEEIENLVKNIKKQNKDWKIYVVDSGSTDATVEIAKRNNVNIIEIPIRGKAIAIKEALSKIDEDYLVMMDSDGSYQAEDIKKILEKLKEADVVIGSRFKGKVVEGAMSTINKFGNFCLSLLASILYLKRVSDVCSGMWGFRKNAYRQLDIRAKHFELEAELFSNCIKKNLKIAEVPITYKKRIGKTKLNPLKDGIKIGLHLLKRKIN